MPVILQVLLQSLRHQLANFWTMDLANQNRETKQTHAGKLAHVVIYSLIAKSIFCFNACGYPCTKNSSFLFKNDVGYPMILKVMLLYICKDADYVWLTILESSPPEPSNTSSKDMTLRCTQQGHSKTINRLLLHMFSQDFPPVLVSASSILSRSGSWPKGKQLSRHSDFLFLFRNKSSYGCVFVFNWKQRN